MAGEMLFRNARIVTAGAIVEGAVAVEAGAIAEVGATAAAEGLDLAGDFLIPGLIELHTDQLEAHYRPRPGVFWNPMAAIQAHDAQLASSGITTVFYALRIGSDVEMPGMADHVDVLLTRQQERSTGSNDVVLQNARVLAVDQLADDATDRPTVVKAVTLEVDTVGAQKIALAASLGNLSLMLRRAGELHVDATRRITTSDLTQTEVMQRAAEAKRFAKVSVTRAAQKQEYNVPAEDAEWRDGTTQVSQKP